MRKILFLVVICGVFFALPYTGLSLDSVKETISETLPTDSEQILDKAQKTIKKVSKDVSKEVRITAEKVSDKVSDTVNETMEHKSQSVDNAEERELRELCRRQTEEYKKYSSGLIEKGTSILREGVTVIPQGQRVVLFKVGDKIGAAFNRSDLPVFYEPQFEDAYNDFPEYSKGMVVLKRDGKWGALNTNLNEINGGVADVTVPFIYDKLSKFRNGTATATLDGKSFTIDRMGRKVN